MVRRLGVALDLHAALRGPSSRKDIYLNACMSKLEFLLQSCHELILAGDFFEKARAEDEVKNRALALLEKYRIPVHVILGNHDIDKDRPDSLGKTSLGNLLYHRSINLLTPDQVWNICGLNVGVLEYEVEKAKMQQFDGLDILVGHHFYNWGRNPAAGLEAQDIAKYNANFIFLGHDHEPHPSEQVGKSVIFRFGSIMRTELSAYTAKHTPSFAIIDIDESNGTYSYPRIITIPHEKFKDVFLYEEKTEFKRCTKLMSDIKELLKSVDVESSSKRTVGQILIEDLNAPKEVVEYLHLIHRVNHLPF